MNSLNDLESFIVFDPTLGKGEDEDHLKILYYYPNTFSEESLIYTVGLCEAMNNFSKEFTEEPCQFIHTQKTRIVIKNLEDNIWIAMTLLIPKSSAKENDFKEEAVQNEICAGILKHCQKMIWLFLGPTSLIMNNEGLNGLKEKLKKFFNSYITTGMLEGYHVTDTLTGIHMLPVDKEIFTEVQQFISQLETKFLSIAGTLFLISSSLIYGTISKEDLGILYRYLTITLLPNLQLNESFTSSNNPSVLYNKNMGKYLTNISNSRKVFLNSKKYVDGNSSCLKNCAVHIYKVFQIHIVLFIDKSAERMDELLTEIHEFSGPLLTPMTQSVFKKIEKIPSESPYRYLFWNPDTLSIKCTLFPIRQMKSEFEPLVSTEVMQVITDIATELGCCNSTSTIGVCNTANHNANHNANDIREFGVKLYSESWVVVLKRHTRHLFLAINKRNFSLVDVSRELKLVCNRDFPSIFAVEIE